MKQPRLSIILAVYNAERFMASTIDSVLEQSYKDWELIIQDGGSSDNTLSIARSYAHENIKIFSEKDKGQGDAIAKAIEKTSGDFLTVLCASDGYLEKEWLTKAMERFDDKEVSVVWGIPFDMTEEGVLQGPHYVFSRFLDPRYAVAAPVNNVSRTKKIFDRITADDGGSVLDVVRRVNIFRLKSLLGTFQNEEPPQKQAWFFYWLRTGTVFPDGNMIVARKAFTDCMPSTVGQKSPDWMDFFFRLNAKGYLSVCVPIPANYGRKHKGHLADELVEFNIKTRKEYYKHITMLSKNISNGSEEPKFVDQNGNAVSGDGKVRLHLGCGEKYLEGYINIDFPDTEHSVMSPKVDQYADIRTLEYPAGSVDEIRSHHLFEHFSRPEALKLLVRWRTWLKPDGVLMIETPDFATSAALFLGAISMKRKFQLSRHIYGSQEAGWALHKDHWDKQKFSFVLKKMGFKNIKVNLYHNGLSRHADKIPGIGKMLARMPHGLYAPFLNAAGTLLPESFYKKFGSNKMPNVLAVAKKDGTVALDTDARVKEILSLGLTGKEGDRLLNVWMSDYKNF